VGYGGAVPEKLFSPQMSELAEDSTFLNYVVSNIVTKFSKTQMAKVAKDAAATSQKKEHTGARRRKLQENQIHR